MTKIKTIIGILNNNTRRHKITKDTATIFNFCIDSVSLEEGVLMVECTTLAGESVEFSFDINSDTKQLPAVLENLNVAGDVNLFLAVAYRLYEASLEPADEDDESIEALKKKIRELEKQLPLPSDLVLSVAHLADATINVLEGSVDAWRDATDKSKITLEELSINIPTDSETHDNLPGYIDDLELKTTLTANNKSIPIGSYTSIRESAGAGRMNLELNEPISATIPVGEDHTIQFNLSIENPRGETVTLNPTLNLDTKEWNGTGGENYGSSIREKTNLTLTLPDTIYNDTPLEITGTLKDNNNKPLADHPVTINLKYKNNTTYTIHDYTDTNGTYTATIPADKLMQGNTTITITYNGTRQYKSATTKKTINIQEKIEEITLIPTWNIEYWDGGVDVTVKCQDGINAGMNCNLFDASLNSGKVSPPTWKSPEELYVGMVSSQLVTGENTLTIKVLPNPHGWKEDTFTYKFTYPQPTQE